MRAAALALALAGCALAHEPSDAAVAGDASPAAPDAAVSACASLTCPDVHARWSCVAGAWTHGLCAPGASTVDELEAVCVRACRADAACPGGPVGVERCE